MDKDMSEDSDQNISRSSQENEVDKSFVGKVKSRVSGLFNSSLSNWFNTREDKKSVIRRRESFEEENDPCSFQPPSKRVKIPSSEQPDLNGVGVYINSENSARTICQPQLRTLTAPSDDSHLKVFHNFAEPVPGPSGVKSRKLLNVPVSASLLKNQEDAANEEKDSDSGGGSTSGYSSTVKHGGKEHGNDKNNDGPVIFQSTPFHNKSLFNSTTANNACSLFSESSLSPQLNSSLSSRRPCFNASAFGSPNFVDKTLSTKRIIESPFYKGHTIYGGASAYGRRASRGVSEMKGAVNKSISIKPKNEIKNAENNPLSKTAQRILSTLEQYSTPVRDAKKIPIANKRQEGILSKYIGAKPYMIRERSRVPSATQLQVPDVPELLKMKERLQESTFNVRQIATSSKSSLNTESVYELKTSEDDQSKHTNKLKTKMSSVRQKKTLESAKEVNLPNVSLPITNLPTFNFIIPPPSTESKKMKDSPKYESSGDSESSNIFAIKPTSTSNPGASIKFAHPICETEKTDKPKSVQNENGENLQFKFSKPVVIAENLKSIVGINNFRFSKPLPRRRAQEDSANVTSTETSKSETIGTDYDVIKNNAKVNASELLKSDLLKNSDSLMMKFKPAEGTWECPECLIRNNPDTEKCAACSFRKPNSDDKKIMSSHNDKLKCPFCASYLNSSDEGCTSCLSKTGKPNPILPPAASNSQNTNSFEGVYKAPTNTWECPTCMIRNKESTNKCEACETARPVSKPLISAFVKKEGEWECEACMVRNASDKIKCACCETPKPNGTSPGSFGFVVAKKEGEWECEACMVKNAHEKLKCVCCETPKPGATLAEPKSSKIDSSFNFGIDKTAISGFKFGIPQPVSTVLETSTTATATSSVTSPTVKFSFGTPKAASPSVTSSSTDFAFGTSKAASSTVTIPTVKFAFGTPKAAAPATQQTSDLEQPKGFVFGNNESTSTGISTGSPSTVTKPDAAVTTSSTFSITQAPATITGNFSTSADFKFGSGAGTTTTVGQMNPPNESLVTSEARESKPAPMFSLPKSQILQPQFKPIAVNGEIPNISKNIFGNVAPITLQTNKPIIPVSTTQASLSFEVKTPALSTSQAPVLSTTESSVPVARPVFKFGASSVAPVTPSASSSAMFNSSSNMMPVKNDFASAASSLQSRKHPAEDNGPYKKKPMYSFGSSDKPIDASKPVPFSFGPSQTNTGTGTGPGGSFSFSLPAAPSVGGFGLKPNSTEKVSATPNLFDGSVQPVVKNGGFNFGTTSNNASQKAGFSFAAATPVVPSNQPGFNFGAPAPQPSSGGFSFAAPNLSKPSFNFTGSSEIPTFTAQPSGEIGHTHRKIKRAIRRFPPR